MPGPLGFWGVWGVGTRGPEASPRFNSRNTSTDALVASALMPGNIDSVNTSSENDVLILPGSILSGRLGAGAVMPAGFTSTDSSTEYLGATNAFFQSINTSTDVLAGGVEAATTLTSVNTSTEILSPGAEMPGNLISQAVSYESLDATVLLTSLTENPTRAGDYGGGSQTVDALANVWVIDPNNVEIPCRAPHFEQRINAGVNWNVTVDRYIDPTTYSPEQTWYLCALTRFGVYRSMPLALKSPPVELGPKTFTILHGIDYTTYRLMTEGFVTITFLNQTAGYILQWIGRFAGVQVGFTDDPLLYQIEEYSIHGGTLLSHFSQICKDFGANWAVGPNGEIQVFPVTSSLTVNRPYSTLKYNRVPNWDALITYLRLRKDSKTTDSNTLVARTPGIQGPTNIGPFDATSIHIAYQNFNGSFVYAGLYDGQSPPQLCYFNNSSNGTIPSGVFTTPTSSLPAQSVIWDVAEPKPGSPLADLPVLVYLTVSGRPPNTFGNYQYRFQIDFPLVVPVYFPTEIVVGGAILPSTPGQQSLNAVTSVWPTMTYAGSVTMPDIRLKIGTLSSSLWTNVSVVESIIGRLWVDYQRDADQWKRDMNEVNPFWNIGENILPETVSVSINGVTTYVDIPASRVDYKVWGVGEDGAGVMSLGGFFPVAIPSGGAFAPYLVSLGNQVLIPGG